MPDFRPQPGKQELFMTSSADIVFYGGAAGGGKTFALLLEFIRNKNINDFACALFRRKLTDAKKPGSLWFEAKKMFLPLQAKHNKNEMSFEFKSDCGTAYLVIGGMENEDDKERYDGSQICYIGFDELTHFSHSQFWYLMQRNRSTCGIKPYVRATCNPHPDSWVKDMVKWWLDKNNEYANEDKSGVIRWYIRINEELTWFDSENEANEYIKKNELYNMDKSGNKIPVESTSFTFIPADVFDNEELLKVDPGYLSRLESLPLVERLRKFKGNWKIKAQAGLLFKREWFEIVNALPNNIERTVRYWDRAGTDPLSQEKNKRKNLKPCNTAGCKMSKDYDGTYYITHMSKFQKRPSDVRKNILAIASQDGGDVDVFLEQEPGSSGIADVEDIIRMLSGYNARADRPTGDKVQRAMPLSAQTEIRNVKLLRGDWNESFLVEAENFDGSGTTLKDQIDAATGAFKSLQVDNKIQTWDNEKPKIDLDSKQGMSIVERRLNAMKNQESESDSK